MLSLSYMLVNFVLFLFIFTFFPWIELIRDAGNTQRYEFILPAFNYTVINMLFAARNMEKSSSLHKSINSFATAELVFAPVFY